MEPTDLVKLRNLFENFVKFPEADWDLLIPYIQDKQLRKHELFAEEGKKANEVAFILEGNFRQYYTNGGEDKTTYFYFPGNLMSAYISCISGHSSQLTIEALTDARMLSFSYNILKQLYLQSSAWQTCGRLIAEYIASGLEERMVSLLLKTPEERYLDLLSGTRKRIIEQVPQQYVASYLGITPVSLSRLRRRIME
jgi:CRP-like cAMP-binding protein